MSTAASGLGKAHGVLVMQKIFLCCILLFIQLIFPSPSHAITETIVCNDCSASAMQIAATEGLIKYGTNNVVVVDFVNKTSRKFTVVNKDDAHGEPFITASETKLSSDEQKSVLALFEYRRLLIDSVKNAEEINKQLFPNNVDAKSL